MKVKKQDAKFDLAMLTKNQKLILYPVFIKLFGFVRATALLFGGK